MRRKHTVGKNVVRPKDCDYWSSVLGRRTDVSGMSVKSERVLGRATERRSANECQSVVVSASPVDRCNRRTLNGGEQRSYLATVVVQRRRYSHFLLARSLSH